MSDICIYLGRKLLVMYLFLSLLEVDLQYLVFIHVAPNEYANDSVKFNCRLHAPFQMLIAKIMLS